MAKKTTLYIIESTLFFEETLSLHISKKQADQKNEKVSYIINFNCLNTFLYVPKKIIFVKN